MWILAGALGAFGAFAALWALFGWLLSGGSGTVICIGSPLFVRRMKLLREAGLFRGEVLTASEESSDISGVEPVLPSELLRRLQTGEKEFDTAGNGDPTGHRVGGGLPEL